MPTNPQDIPELYKRYRWNDRHALWGYGADEFPTFEWIGALERRFANTVGRADAPVFLIREMIHWGGSQNGVLEKFDLSLGTYNLSELFGRLCKNLEQPDAAIRTALEIPGMGLSYASKLLRFLRPDKYGALDGQIREHLIETSDFPKIYDGITNNMVNGFVKFTQLLSDLKEELQRRDIARPGSASETLQWRNADIEMAIFQQALERKIQRAAERRIERRASRA